MNQDTQAIDTPLTDPDLMALQHIASQLGMTVEDAAELMASRGLAIYQQNDAPRVTH